MQRQRPLIILLVSVIIFGIGLWLGFIATRVVGLLSGPRVMGTATVLKQVQTLSELVTVKYVMEKVVIFEDVKWYPGGDNRVMLLAHGIVKAGVDFKQLADGDISVSGKTITIRLPTSRITDCYLDEHETKVIEHNTGLLRTFDKNLEQTARQTAISDISRSARAAGILTDADERASDQLKLLLLQMGFESVEIRSK